MKVKSSPKPPSGKAGGRETAAGAMGDFSRPIQVDDVPETGLDVSIEADSAERAAIAESNGLPEIASLKAEFKVQKLDRANVKVTGLLRAALTQICVVSLEPFPSEITAGIDADFAPARPGGNAEAVIDGPDPIIDGRIDLGALAEEFLVLSLDPYPRKPGVEFDDSIASVEANAKPSPFEALRKLKTDK